MFAGGVIYENGLIGLSNQVKVFDPKTESWYEEQPLSVARTKITSAVNFEGQQGNQVIFAGGLAKRSQNDDQWVLSAVADIYSAKTGLWKSYPNALSVPRFGMSAITLGKGSGETFFVGGFAGGYIFRVSYSSDVVDAYNPTTDSWSPKNLVLIGGARGYMAVGRCYTRGYDPMFLFFGGSANSFGENPSNVVDIYDEVYNTWVTTSVSVARSFVGVATASSSKASNSVIFAGGYTGTDSVANVDIFRSSNLNSLGVWSSAVLPEPICGLVGVTYGATVVFAGGTLRTKGSEIKSDKVFVYSNGVFTTLKLSIATVQPAIAISSFIEFRLGGSAINYIVFAGSKLEQGGVSVNYAELLAVGNAAVCKSGEYRVGNSCSRCVPGYWGNTTAALGTDPSCSGPCAAGRYGDNSLGDYQQSVSSNPSGLLTSPMCTGICLPGYNCPTGSVSKKQSTCPSGSFSDFGAGICTTCPSGFALGSSNKPRKVHLTVVPDINNKEFSWSFKDSSGQILLSQGRGLAAGGNFEFEYSGISGSEITFQMLDGGGDGICCQYGGSSYYEISVDGIPIHRGGKFSGIDTYIFQAGNKHECVVSSTQVPSTTSRSTTYPATTMTSVTTTTTSLPSTNLLSTTISTTNTSTTTSTTASITTGAPDVNVVSTEIPLTTRTRPNTTEFISFESSAAQMSIAASLMAFLLVAFI